MRVHICAVGRLRTGPELTLLEDYLDRFDKIGRNLGLGPSQVHQVEDRSGGGLPAQADLLRKVIPKGATLIAMDERGRMMSSPQFAQILGGLRDDGCGDLAFLIGGADGLDRTLVAECQECISLGQMVWPHMLVRVMLSEQLYRTASILAGSPYHRA